MAAETRRQDEIKLWNYAADDSDSMFWKDRFSFDAKVTTSFILLNIHMNQTSTQHCGAGCSTKSILKSMNISYIFACWSIDVSGSHKQGADGYFMVRSHRQEL